MLRNLFQGLAGLLLAAGAVGCGDITGEPDSYGVYRRDYGVYRGDYPHRYYDGGFYDGGFYDGRAYYNERREMNKDRGDRNTRIEDRRDDGRLNGSARSYEERKASRAADEGVPGAAHRERELRHERLER